VCVCVYVSVCVRVCVSEVLIERIIKHKLDWIFSFCYSSGSLETRSSGMMETFSNSGWVAMEHYSFRCY